MNQPTDQRSLLLAECHRLLNQVACRPGYVKLLGLARNHLRMLAQYKSNRRQRQRGSE